MIVCRWRMIFESSDTRFRYGSTAVGGCGDDRLMFHCAMADIDLASRPPRIALATIEDFSLGGLRVRPSLRRVEMAGEIRDLAPRVMQVLVALASARPDVLSRDRLIELCWDGRIVGDDALNRCILALRNLARTFSPEPFTIETVPRVGHRLIAATADDAPAGQWASAPSVPGWRNPSRATLSLVALAIGLIAAMAVWLTVRSAGQARAPASIAVLPFRNLSSGDPYFAEGVGEEILSQLGRQTNFRVIGRTSAAAFRNATDVRDVGRKLGVDYILEGSVLSAQGRVRVDTSLVDTGNGMRIWSHSYDRRLDDIFAIQNAIGASVAGSLERTVFRDRPLNGPLVTDGQTYSLYLHARGLLRTRQTPLAEAATDVLRQAIRRDPGYAPAWSSLAQALRLRANGHGAEAVIAATPPAIGAARRALQLAPDLAEAHGVLGMLMNYVSPEAQEHVRRAAALDPGSAENLYWLGITEQSSGHFQRSFQAFSRAAEIDPLWFGPIRELALTYVQQGRSERAKALIDRRLVSDPVTRHLLLGHIAWASNDLSEAVRQWSIAAKSDSALSEWGASFRDQALIALGLSDKPNDKNKMEDAGLMAITAPTSPEVWRAHTRNAAADYVYGEENHAAAKMMLGTGRIAELLATYDSATGLLDIRAGQPLRVDLVNVAPVVAMTLRRGGRKAEADRLLTEAEAGIRAIYARETVPNSFDADAAAVAAVRGRRDEALALLERAYKRGWRHAALDDLPRLSAEPAFETLRDLPRFRAIEQGLDAWRDREKRETAALVV